MRCYPQQEKVAKTKVKCIAVLYFDFTRIVGDIFESWYIYLQQNSNEMSANKMHMNSAIG